KAERAFLEAEKLLGRMKPETLSQAKGRYEEALSLWSALGDRNREADTLSRYGLVQHLLGEYRESLKTFQRVQLLNHEADDREKEALALSNIASVFATLGELQQGIEHYQRALTLYRAINDRQAEARTLSGIGLIYFRLGDYKSSLAYHNQA